MVKYTVLDRVWCYCDVKIEKKHFCLKPNIKFQTYIYTFMEKYLLNMNQIKYKSI